MIIYMVITFYFSYAIYFNIFNFKRLYSSSTNFYPVKLNSTLLSTFFENNNILLMNVWGFMLFVILSINKGWGYSCLISYLTNHLLNIRMIRKVFMYHSVEILTLLSILLSIFTSQMIRSGRILLLNDVKILKEELLMKKKKSKIENT